MKKTFLLSIIFALALSMQAKSLVITLDDGTDVYYLLGGDEDPVMKFVDGKVVIKTDSYEFSNIKKFYISQTDDPVGIKAETLYLKGDKTIEVYSLDGKKMDIDTTTTDAISAVNTSPLPKGVYIIRIGNQQMKVLKK